MIRLKNIFFAFSIILVIALLTTLAACSAGQSADTTAETYANAESSEEVVENTEAPVTETLAEEQIQEETPEASSVVTALKLESTNGAYTNAGNINWDELGTQVGEIQQFDGRTTAFIYIATYEVAEEDIYNASVPEGQAILYFVATVQKEGNNLPFETGTYDLTKFQGDVPKTAEMGIKLAGGITVQLDTFKITVSEFEITSVTDKEITGKFNIEEKWTTTSGEFTVKIK